MGETAKPLSEQEPTPTPTPVSGVVQSVRPPEVETKTEETHDLLATALDELGVEAANDVGTAKLDPEQILAIAEKAKEKAKLAPKAEVKKSLDEPSLDTNAEPEMPDSATAAE